MAQKGMVSLAAWKDEERLPFWLFRHPGIILPRPAIKLMQATTQTF